MKKISKKLLLVGALSIFVTFVFTSVCGIYYTDGGSMEPTVKDGQIVLANKIYYNYREPGRFHVVILYDVEDKGFLQKRLIGLPGEILEIKSGKFFINNIELKDPYNTIPEIKNFDYGPKRIPDDMYFYIGDDRKDSIWGYVDKKDIKAKVFFY